MSKRCSNCEHFNALDEGINHCRAHPPVVHCIVDQGAVLWRTRFPEVHPGSWCGEFSRSPGTYYPITDELVGSHPDLLNLVQTLANIDVGNMSIDDAWEALCQAVCLARDIAREGIQP